VRLAECFGKVLKSLKKDVFWNNFGTTISFPHPDIDALFGGKIRDLQKIDCGIVVIGNIKKLYYKQNH
jgi:hypothetical protein